MSESHSWLKRCNVKYCTNHYKAHISFFNVPRDPVLFKKWSEAVYCTGTLLQRNGRICEKHFDPKDIIEFKCLKKSENPKNKETNSEPVTITVPRLGAVPSVFNDEVQEYEKQLSLNKVKPLPKLPDNPTDSENISPQSQVLPVANTNIVRVPVIVETKSPEEVFFDKIFDRLIEPRLPNKSWNIHNCQHPQRGIIFTELAELNPDVAVPPFLKKSVFFDKNLDMRIYIFGKYFSNVEYSKPKSISGLEDLLLQIDCFKICEGGPDLPNLRESKFAFRDVGIYKWRHKNCEFRVERGRICKNCLLLSNIVNQCTSDLSIKPGSVQSPLKKLKLEHNLINKTVLNKNKLQSKR